MEVYVGEEFMNQPIFEEELKTRVRSYIISRNVTITLILVHPILIPVKSIRVRLLGICNEIN